MEKKTQNRLIVWMIWIMQWLLMAAACAAFYIFSANSDGIAGFVGVFFIISSFMAHKLRIQFFREFTGIEKSVDFFKWLGKQNRRTRRHYGRVIAKHGRKSGTKQR